jgi:hypothetical protein
LDARLAAIRDRVMQAVRSLPPNPLHEAATDLHQEMDTRDDNDEE